MSRCFPFPPPGYEKKSRLDDADLLKKEPREKKHKEKDKEKKEDKEKREKDRSDGKHRDKKDRKEKRREKKEKKERDKAKDKNNTSEEKRIPGQSESYNGEKLNHKEKKRDKDQKHISDEKEQTLELQDHSRGKPIRNILLAEGPSNSKFVQELGRRTRDEEKGTGSQLVKRLPHPQPKNDVRIDEVAVKHTEILAGGKENNEEQRIDNRKINGQGVMGEARSSGTAVVQNLTGMIQNRVEGMTRPLEKIERRIEERDKSKERGGDNKRGEKQRDRDREKKSHGKDKDREKEEKVNKINENKTKDQDKFKNSNKNDHLGTWNIKSSFVSKDGDRNTATEGILKKRKDPEANGFLLDTDVRPNKMPRPNPHPSTENGRKLEPCQNPILFTSDRLGPLNSFKANNNERKINGVIEAQPLLISKKSSSDQIAQAATKPPNHGVIETQPLFVCKKSSSFANTQADKIAEASTKPPHPDSKYLSQILSVPKLDEWSDFDDGEWLFSSNDCSAKKPNVESAEAAEAPRVWAEALQIESADVCALPYVVPY
ncbi:uncharacterized protein LOC130765306 [Actinidia eriantha]|uniref:uncharacterized protein LOC130765306 n=1 Tax=Actinidia eriantha TaxID=165200 RepID=UPI00259000BA|nr:uncharacterized protein LOC130765306 [Actinidia eriantha]